MKDIQILIKLYFVFPNSFSKARKNFHMVHNKECAKPNDVDFIHLSSGIGCAVILKFSCVSVFESMSSFERCLSYMYQVFVGEGIVTSPMSWNHTTAVLDAFVSVDLCSGTYLVSLTIPCSVKVGNKNINAAQTFS